MKWSVIVVDFYFFVVSQRGEWQLPGTFFSMKKYFSSLKLSNFEISKIHIQLHCTGEL